MKAFRAVLIVIAFVMLASAASARPHHVTPNEALTAPSAADCSKWERPRIEDYTNEDAEWDEACGRIYRHAHPGAAPPLKP